MQQLGATVREVDLPHSCYGSSASWSIAYTESFAFHRANFFARSRDYTHAFLHKITGAACLTAEERITAQRLRQVITAEFLAALTRGRCHCHAHHRLRRLSHWWYLSPGRHAQSDAPGEPDRPPGSRRALRFYQHTVSR